MIMAWWQWLVGILLFIVALGVLIGIHELGHLGAAKLFHVYCFNYSIGFGPTLLSSKRSVKHETIWTLRAIPLGGFVSMYGEGVEIEEGLYIPPSRSLEGVARYKRAIIVSAGVICNFILGFVLILCHNAFDQVSYHLYSMQSIDDRYHCCFKVNKNDDLGLLDGDAIKFSIDPLTKVQVQSNVYTTVFKLAKDIEIEGIADKQVLCYKNVITTTKYDPDLSSSLVLYKQVEPKFVIDKAITSGFTDSTLISLYATNNNLTSKDQDKLTEYQNKIAALSKDEKNAEFTTQANEYYVGQDGIAFDVSTPYNITDSSPESINNIPLTFYRLNEEKKYTKENLYNLNINLNIDKSSKTFKETGIKETRDVVHYSFGQALQVSGREWCAANSTIFVALGQLFTGHIENLGGLIAIANQSSRVLAGFGFERFLYLWGMISCNLAIVNLLPFPGLDGWTLVVTAYEGIRKKQIPTKVKNIVSLIGLGLLFALMILIFIKDIFTIV